MESAAGTPPGGEQSLVGQDGSGHGLWFSAESSGMSCLAALVLSYIASSKADSVREESGIWLHVQLMRT